MVEEFSENRYKTAARTGLIPESLDFVVMRYYRVQWDLSMDE
jgi:hypothetical protein